MGPHSTVIEPCVATLRTSAILPAFSRSFGLESYVKMIKWLKPLSRAASRAAGEALIGGKPSPIRRLSTAPTLRMNPTLDAPTSTRRPAVALNSRRHRAVFRVKPVGYLLQSRQASDDALTSHGGFNRTALHELHISNGGKMVPFGGYSMPVQYSDLGVGESHRWTREKASLFDVGHM